MPARKPKKRLWVRLLGSLLFGPSNLDSTLGLLVSGPGLIFTVGIIGSNVTISDACKYSSQCHLSHDLESIQHVVAALIHPISTLHQIPGFAIVPFLIGVIYFYIYLAFTAIYLFRETWNLGRFVARGTRKLVQWLKFV